MPSNVGHGANDGAYYPVGLLAVATRLRRALQNVSVSVIDGHHVVDPMPAADVIGISASSTLSYENVLRLAERAKRHNSVVVLGGPHATQLADQILRNRPGLIDFVIRGNGEETFATLISAVQGNHSHAGIPGLSWRSRSGEIIHNPSAKSAWAYDSQLPLDFDVLSGGLSPYWDVFRRKIDRSVDAAFVVFTHFGCTYRDRMQAGSRAAGISRWCSYCSLADSLAARLPEKIVSEIEHLLRLNSVPAGSRILLKCYGDNAGGQIQMLQALAAAMQVSRELRRYDIGWTFYCQSSRLSRAAVDAFAAVGTRNLFIGFDSADDRVQRLNGLGTSLAGHLRAVRLCKGAGIRIQAGFVLGCAGETRDSLDATVRFAEVLGSDSVLERVNAAVLFVIPGSPAYELLKVREPWIEPLDALPTEALQLAWIRHFCPSLGPTPNEGLDLLKCYARRLDELSPGPHTRMGYENTAASVASAAGVR